MERRHQVFISSTFADLKKERAEIVQALLELDCFPAGMEIFPATTDAAWDLIKGVIEDSDYYCLVVGGRYGSLDGEGISYTEKEYDYAITIGKPVVAFLHKNPGAIPQHMCEISEEGRQKLGAFRAKVEGAHHCKYWETAEELGGRVSRAIVALKKSHPSDGWVPGTYASDGSLDLEVATLRARVAELEAELTKRAAEDSPSSLSNIAGGEDKASFTIYVMRPNLGAQEVVSTTWDTILKYVGPTLLPECSEEDFLERLKLCFYHAADKQPGKDAQYAGTVVPHVTTDQVKIQLRALGQMAPGTKRRAVSDRKTYWKLTSAGEARLLAVRALSKPQPSLPFPPPLPMPPIARPQIQPAPQGDGGVGGQLLRSETARVTNAP